jgi:hypothetical protein
MKNSFRFKSIPYRFTIRCLNLLIYSKIQVFVFITQWGALRLRAEIIPTEPDPGNAGAGMANRNHLPHWLFINHFKN